MPCYKMRLVEARTDREGGLARILGGILSLGGELRAENIVDHVDHTILGEDIGLHDAGILDEESSLLVDLDILALQGLEGGTVLDRRGVEGLAVDDVISEDGGKFLLAQAVDALLNSLEGLVSWHKVGGFLEVLDFIQQAGLAQCSNEPGAVDGVDSRVGQLRGKTAGNVEHIIDRIDDSSAEFHLDWGLGKGVSSSEESSLEGAVVIAAHDDLATGKSGPRSRPDSSLVWGKAFGEVVIDAIDDVVSNESLEVVDVRVLQFLISGIPREESEGNIAGCKDSDIGEALQCGAEGWDLTDMGAEIAESLGLVQESDQVQRRGVWESRRGWSRKGK